jgi:hypothetical protein
MTKRVTSYSRLSKDKKENIKSFLSDNCPPMGIYETLYAFKDSFGSFMGEEGTHPPLNWKNSMALPCQEV